MKKYELVKEDFIIWKGKKLYRIRALREFDNVKVGDLGGYIESADNLSQNGNCWIYNQGKAYDKARIFDNAVLYDNAQAYNGAKILENAIISENVKIFGYAQIFGNTQIFGRAKVFGHAQVRGNSLVFGNARIWGKVEVNYSANVFGDVEISEGTIIGDINLPFKKIFQHQCRNRILTAILTKDNKILYTIGCQINITKEVFLDRIYNQGGGLDKNPHRKEYLILIPLIEEYFKQYEEEN